MAKLAQSKPQHPSISTHRVEGTPVFNLQGGRIGKIDHVMIDKVSGQVTSAILCYGVDWAESHGHYPVPWSCLKFDTERHGYVIDEAMLRDTRPVALRELRGEDLPWREGANDHWAAPPYWFGKGQPPSGRGA